MFLLHVFLCEKNSYQMQMTLCLITMQVHGQSTEFHVKYIFIKISMYQMIDHCLETS